MDSYASDYETELESQFTNFRSSRPCTTIGKYSYRCSTNTSKFTKTPKPDKKENLLDTILSEK
jgi:hypothetical protein